VTSYDVGIVGAGVHGASAANHLARRGVSTVVFEANTPASGPTGQSSGIVRSYYTNPFLAEVARDSTAFLADFPSKTNGADSGYRRTGGLYLHGENDVDHVMRTADSFAQLTISHDVLSPAQLTARFPSLNFDDVAIGVWEENAGYADPHQTTLGLIAAAVALGAHIQQRTQVTTLVEGRDSVRVELANGQKVQVNQLLIAAGPWTGPLASALGVTLPLRVERHVVAGLHQPASNEPIDANHVIIDVAGGYYSRPLEPDQFLLGPLAPGEVATPDDFSTRVSDLEFAWLAERAIERVPSRALAAAHTSWASLYDVSPDWQPVIGNLTERVFVDAGTSGHGFKLAPVLGDHVAKMLTDEADPRLAQFTPERFSIGATLDSGFGVARILG
jgi:glycine/D-amino acid oxidase-like deaminating enzyme